MNQRKAEEIATAARILTPVRESLRPVRLCLLVAAVLVQNARALNAPPPELAREFRGAWVATVYNIDWPSKAGLPAAQQQLELRALLDRAASLKLNAIVLQVRPQCDALYASTLEPWSSFLTGRMGTAPAPFYDPLQFAISEAHARGLELHAWFNPFRALANANAPVSPSHISKTHPEWVRRYGTQLWLDPGEPAAREYALAVILDVVRRYDIDGVHMDDYFYPYPTKERTDFPDEKPWGQYRMREGELSRDDWRRENINTFIATLHRAIKAEKAWVKFGISPFGIWRPKVPPTIEAQLDSYAHLYADSKRWLNEGWCDYFSPQLYWSIEPAKQSFPVLLEWWRSQNTAHRHIWPGIATSRIGATRKAAEITSEIELTRRNSDAGHIHWSVRSLLRNADGVSDLLGRGMYAETALIPESPWLGAASLEKPPLTSAGGQVTWKTYSATEPRWWLVQTLREAQWNARLLPGSSRGARAEAGTQAVAVRGVDRASMLGEVAVISLR